MKQVRRILVVIFAAVVAVAVGWSPPAAADVDVYTTPGTHHVNGRDWRTTCEPYSQTERCRTEIWSTHITQAGGVFKSTNGWNFNNLTYKASPRALWASNPLGHAGSWTAADGRQWRTECDTPTTGRNGCRSYARADVIEGYQSAGVWHYRWTNKWVFNNAVRFTAGASVSPASIVDPNLRACITAQLGVSNTAQLTAAQLGSVDELWCPEKGIATLRGMPNFPNVSSLNLSGNQLTTLEGMPLLVNLKGIGLQDNQLTTLQHIPKLPKIVGLNVGNNSLTSVAPLVKLSTLRQLHLFGNTITDVHLLDGLVAAGLQIG